MRRLSTGAADETANRPAGEKLHCQTPTSLLRERVNGCSLYSTSEPLCPEPACVRAVLCVAANLLLLRCPAAAPRPPARCAAAALALQARTTHAPPLPTPRPACERSEGLRRRRAVAALLRS